MKRVHYLAGAVGLAPAAFGLVTGPAAHAADAPAHAADVAAASAHAPRGVKTVSLHHIRRAAATAVAAASSSSSSGGTSPAITGGACGGNTLFRIPKLDNVKGHGWYRNGPVDSYTCIGIVDVHLWFNKTMCKTADLSLHLGEGTSRTSGSQKVCGTAGHGKSTSFSVQERWWHIPGSPVDVCAWSTYGGKTCRGVGS
jgi:hypothetical protein